MKSASLLRTHQCGAAAFQAEQEASLLEAQEVFGLGSIEVREKHRLHLRGELAVLDRRREFEVQHERAVVHVDGSDDREVVVGEEDFLVHEPGLVAPDLDARLAEFGVVGEGGEPGQEVVGHLGKDHAHIHAADGGVADREEERAGGNEIRAGNPEPAGGGIDDGKKDGRADAPAFSGAGGDGKNRGVARRVENGRREAEGRDFIFDVVPILEERELESGDGGALDAEVGVAPGSEAAAAPHVFVADIETAEEGGAGIDDDEFAVVAEVDLEAASELSVGDEGFDPHALAA
jgi:hypothetical protein